MDSSKLKGRQPYPFETIGVAISFSSKLVEVLTEAKRLVEIFKARLVIAHVGDRTPDKESVLRSALEQVGTAGIDCLIVWRGGNPVKGLLEICKENLIDLLVLRAKRREKKVSYYLGSVVRRFSRAAKCSFLLLTEPTTGGTSFDRVVVNSSRNPKTPLTMKTAAYFSQRVDSREMAVVTESDQLGLAMVMAYDSNVSRDTFFRDELTSEEAQLLREMIGLSPQGVIKVSEKIVLGRPGYAIRQYAAEINADLLVIHSPDAKYGLMDRIFTHDMEYILENLPCNLLVVHSRISS